MEPHATIVRGRDGTERVLVDLADFQAVLDAAHSAAYGLPDVESIVKRLGAVLAAPRGDAVDLDQFLAEYDALHGES